MPDPSQGVSPERLKIAIEVWKQVVAVQMHFNDMEMKVRNLYFTILAATLGLIGVMQSRRTHLGFFGLLPEVNVSMSIFILLMIIPVTFLFYFIDRHWYHRLLLGAVKQSTFIENSYKDDLPEIQLGLAVSKESPVQYALWTRYPLFFVSDHRFRKTAVMHSDAKIEILYKSVMFGALLIAVGYGLTGGVEVKFRNEPPSAAAADHPAVHSPAIPTIAPNYRSIVPTKAPQPPEPKGALSVGPQSPAE